MSSTPEGGTSVQRLPGTVTLTFSETAGTPAFGEVVGPAGKAALKCLYLVTRSQDPTGRGSARWMMRWKPALNAFAITFEGRITPSITN